MADAAIVAEGLGKCFGPVVALDRVDLELPAGGVLGVLGPNGAGKTTAVRILATLLKPDRGRAWVAGFDVAERPAEVRRRIGLSGQYAAVDPFLTGRENLIMIGQLYGLTRRQARSRAGDLIGQLELDGAAGRLVRTYSTMFQIGRAGDDQAVLAPLLARFARWSAARAAAQTATLIVMAIAVALGT